MSQNPRPVRVINTDLEDLVNGYIAGNFIEEDIPVMNGKEIRQIDIVEWLENRFAHVFFVDGTKDIVLEKKCHLVPVQLTMVL